MRTIWVSEESTILGQQEIKMCRISTLIEYLSNIRKEYGDIEILAEKEGFGELFDIKICNDNPITTAFITTKL